jgi:hypothetical protein
MWSQASHSDVVKRADPRCRRDFLGDGRMARVLAIDAAYMGFGPQLEEREEILAQFAGRTKLRAIGGNPVKKIRVHSFVFREFIEADACHVRFLVREMLDRVLRKCLERASDFRGGRVGARVD